MKKLILLTLAAALTLWSCEKEGPEKVDVTSVTLDKTEIALEVGSEDVIKATVAPDNATEKTVKWTSSNSSAATVDSNGKVSALAEGSATITATCDGKSATCKVNVVAEVIAVTKVTLDKTTLALEIGDEETLKATVAPDNASVKTVTWTSSAQAIATVDDNGKVKAIGEGTATITATCGGQSATCTVEVVAEVIPVTEVTLDKTEITLEVGGEETLTATVKPDDATSKTVSWTSSEPTIATVDDNGKVKAIADGTATITATCGEKSATCTVTSVVSVTGISLDKEDMLVEIGDETVLTATLAPENATDKTVTWKSDEPTIASVDANGKVTAVAEGKTIITASSNGFEATCSFWVVTEIVDVTGVTLNHLTRSLLIGETQEVTLEATVAPANATVQTVAWTSSAPAVATVDDNGKVTAVSAGTATITATCGEHSAACEITVLTILDSGSFEAVDDHDVKDETLTMGTTISWKLTSDGTLTFSGNGAMSRYTQTTANQTPWASKKSSITAMIFEEGITYISSQAFRDYKQVKTLSFPSTLDKIGNFAFGGCTFESITLPANLKTIEADVFSYMGTLKTVTCLATTPPALAGGNFGASDDKLYVPAGSVNAYTAINNWKNNFTTSGTTHIYEIE